MKTMTIYGASDDLIQVAGVPARGVHRGATAQYTNRVPITRESVRLAAQALERDGGIVNTTSLLNVLIELGIIDTYNIAEGGTR